MSRSRLLAAVVAAALAVSILPLVTASARTQSSQGTDIIDVGDIGGGKLLPVDVTPGESIAARRTAAAAKYSVGAKKLWLAYDDLQGLYVKNYKLRGRGKHVEVWVVNGEDALCDGDPETPCPAGDETATVTGTHFPDGDCRNDRVKVTDRQVNYLIRQFDRNIYPKESKLYSVPPNRNGEGAPLADAIGVNANYWKGGGDNIVVLVDNFRDENFYDINSGPSYIAGFFSSTFSDYHNRNIMNIDAFDWLHRTGPNPPNDPVPGDLCENATSRPYLYEGVFAHEYEHLLESVEDPNETIWADEGLADFAAAFTGYVDYLKTINDPGYEGSTQCFTGWTGVQTPANGVPFDGGPSNSLTLWGDHGGDQILCDYGAAGSFMLYAADTFGKDFMTRLHRINANGFNGLAKDLEAEGSSLEPLDVVHRWLATMALDAVLDDGATLTGGTAGDYQVTRLNSIINWDSPDAWDIDPDTQDHDGAPPNGGDFVRLRAANGDYLGAGDLRSLEFEGVPQLPAIPLAWTVDLTPPDHTADPALYSGKGDNLDVAAAHEVAVPAAGGTLTFENRYAMEEGYDYGYVQVSDDNGETWKTLSNDHTVEEGGFNGDSGCALGEQGTCDPTWVNETFDLSAYAGKTIYISFRYVTDGGVAEDGWWIDDVKVGDTVLTDGTTTVGWESPTEVNPVEVAGYTLQLIAYNDLHTQAWIANVPIDPATFTASLTQAQLEALVGTTAETVSAIVTYDEPTEKVNQYAPYTLTVNNVEQPGGS